MPWPNSALARRHQRMLCCLTQSETVALPLERTEAPTRRRRHGSSRHGGGGRCRLIARSRWGIRAAGRPRSRAFPRGKTSPPPSASVGPGGGLPLGVTLALALALAPPRQWKQPRRRAAPSSSPWGLVARLGLCGCEFTRASDLREIASFAFFPSRDAQSKSMHGDGRSI
ncbi:hypothetical protein AAFF_G00198890 [Aldrovandia affinis]|uniref:Uncharacterized protein n=1 Tax=Aldrovandia affinis TaxID=143900 RepID=A0AAD7RI01_9TELE|nr:hypothetical protein AAFF_G00198890 [Aldrovandia affinis]